jgi:hypothetical protein
MGAKFVGAKCDSATAWGEGFRPFIMPSHFNMSHSNGRHPTIYFGQKRNFDIPSENCHTKRRWKDFIPSGNQRIGM